MLTCGRGVGRNIPERGIPPPRSEVSQKMGNDALATAALAVWVLGPRGKMVGGVHRHLQLRSYTADPRPLSHSEERQLLRVVPELGPRDRALVTAQWMIGVLHLGNPVA